MNHLSSTQRKELKRALLDRKAELKHHFQENGEEHAELGESLTDATGELSAYDNHPADIGTESFERGRDLALNETFREELDNIQTALKRMDHGTYGMCIVCGRPIPFERLQSIPYTAYCIDHTPERNIPDDRPIEEKVMTPPPSGAGKLRQEYDVKFDADAWEQVEDYGTSTTPAISAKRDVKND